MKAFKLITPKNKLTKYTRPQCQLYTLYAECENPIIKGSGDISDGFEEGDPDTFTPIP